MRLKTYLEVPSAQADVEVLSTDSAPAESEQSIRLKTLEVVAES
jgi:hypothetical protein